MGSISGSRWEMGGGGSGTFVTGGCVSLAGATARLSLVGKLGLISLFYIGSTTGSKRRIGRGGAGILMVGDWVSLLGVIG